ncbi:MAG TPA: S-methyl-5-thioribose-1-phosphate isomerase [Actinomycetota bacterium]|nr:S-methyl-5-thioribose-1-phosphate isomerase [Actinomycetota bacterium]
MRAIDWDAGTIRIIDQTLLPQEERILTLTSTAELADAIRHLRVRGAPALGIAGGMGVAQAAFRSQAAGIPGILRDIEAAARELAATRPTAANLAWGIDRVARIARDRAGDTDRDKLLALLEEEALRIAQEDANACMAMARHTQRYIAPKAVVLTHCNTGFLCTGGYGTALGAIRLAHEEGKEIAVLATETRPLLQGARLTAWELGKFGVPHALIADGAAAGLIARGEVKVVIVGADRIAANGDVANKVGTFGLALAARDAGIPFIVVAPMSTVDLEMRSGDKIPIEERAAGEVTTILGKQVAPVGTYAVNPAFDVTPARLITAIVTENGVAPAPFAASLKRLAGPPSRQRAPARPTSKPPAKKSAKVAPKSRRAAPKARAKPSPARKARPAPVKRRPARKK